MKCAFPGYLKFCPEFLYLVVFLALHKVGHSKKCMAWCTDVRACRAAMGKVRCVHNLGKCVQNGDRCVPDHFACVQGACKCVNMVYYDVYVCTYSTYIKANVYSKFFFFDGGDIAIDLGQIFLYLGCVILL